MYNIAIIGGGVIGITSAVSLQKNLGPKAKITVFASELSPNTTGDISAGLWMPYLLQETPEDDVSKWGKSTYDYFLTLWKEGHAREAGLALVHVIKGSQEKHMPLHFWHKNVLSYQYLTREHIEKINRGLYKNFNSGLSFVSFVCQINQFLPFLQRQFTANGGTIQQKTINSLDEVAKFDVIVNCTGLYSKTLLNDNYVTPIRGQVTRVQAPAQFHVVYDDNNYIIPNIDCVILGGTAQVGDTYDKVRNTDKEMILNGCYNLVPILKMAPILKHQVGFRPSRIKLRLELEQILVGKKTVHVVHNYGHSGSGVTLSYGCAQDVVMLVNQALNIDHRSKL